MATRAELQAGWAALGVTAASLATAAGLRAVQELFADIISAWGEVASTLAADFYDEQRAMADPGGRFAAVILDPLNEDQVDRLVANALTTPVPTQDPAQLLARLEGSNQRLLRQAQRSTIDLSARRDPSARVARVPMGDKTCAFCLVLASRGYVYRSRESAGEVRASTTLGGDARGSLNRFHDWCDCELDVSWAARPVPPEGYDPGELYGKYDAARGQAGSGDLRKVLRELRLLEGVR